MRGGREGAAWFVTDGVAVAVVFEASDVPVCCGVTPLRNRLVLELLLEAEAEAGAPGELAPVPVECSSGARNGLCDATELSRAPVVAFVFEEVVLLVAGAAAAFEVVAASLPKGSYGGGGSSGSGSISASLLFRDMVAFVGSDDFDIVSLVDGGGKEKEFDGLSWWGSGAVSVRAWLFLAHAWCRQAFPGKNKHNSASPLPLFFHDIQAHDSRKKWSRVKYGTRTFLVSKDFRGFLLILCKGPKHCPSLDQLGCSLTLQALG